MSNVKIALAHDWLTNYAGSEQLLFYLHQLYLQAPIYTTIYNQDNVDHRKFDPKLIKTSWLQNIPGSQNRHQLAVPLMPLAIGWNLSNYDLVISDSSWAMKGLQARKHIAIILTPTRWLWGFGGDSRADNLLTKPLKSLLKRWDYQAAQKPDLLIAISKTVQERIKRVYHRDSIVVYPPVEVDRFKILPEGEIEDYFLWVGRLVPYKKVDLIIRTFNDLGWPLKIIGRGPEEIKLKKMAHSNIEFLGAITDNRRDWYYERARAFIFPVDEDFGITPVEAMAAGRPVIAYAKGGATETVIDGRNGIFFQEQNCQSLIRALKKFNQLKFNASDIKKSVQPFNPQRFMAETKKIVDFNLRA